MRLVEREREESDEEGRKEGRGQFEEVEATFHATLSLLRPLDVIASSERTRERRRQDGSDEGHHNRRPGDIIPGDFAGQYWGYELMCSSRERDSDAWVHVAENDILHGFPSCCCLFLAGGTEGERHSVFLGQ